MERVAIFWDIDSCPVPAKLTGYEAINNIRNLAYSYGSATTFKAYVDSSNVPPARLQSVRHEFESSGLLLIEHKWGDESNTITHTMIADMLVFAIDHPTPATIILISDKNELAYTTSLLRHRRYRVIVVGSLSPNETLKSQASVNLDWEVVASQPISEKPMPEITFGSFSSLAGNNKPSSVSQDVGAIANDTNRPIVIPRSTRAKSIGSANTSSRFSALDSTSSHRTRPSTVGWRNLNPNLNIDPNTNPPTNPVTFKPFKLRRLTSSIGEPTNSSTGEDNGPSVSEPLHLDSIGPVVPNATLSSNPSNTHQPPPHRESYPPSFANLSGDFSSDLLSRKRLGLDPSLSPVRIARALVGTEEILSHMAVSPPSEKTKMGTPPASPHWTTASHGPFPKQGTTAPLDESIPPILPSPKVFTLLVEQLEKLRLAGSHKPLRSLVGCELNKRVYAQAGVQGFSPYVALAERMGIVELGGVGGKAWIGLQENWRAIFNKDT